MATSVFDLPEWRRPMPGRKGEWYDDDEIGGGVRLRGALVDLVTDEPQTFEQLAEAVREQWGEASSEQIRAQLRELVRDGRVARRAGRYVRVDADEGGAA